MMKAWGKEPYMGNYNECVVENDLEELFTKVWCPLFGELPFGYLDEPISVILLQCERIIKEARFICDAFPDDWESLHKSWPEPKEVADYPE